MNEWTTTDPGTSLVDADPLPEEELVDQADLYEDELAAEMLRTGAIEVWL